MRRLHIPLAILFALLLNGCDGGKSHETSSSPLPTAPPTSAALLSAFEADQKACASLMKVLEADRLFVEGFLSVQIRQKHSTESLLRQSAASKSPEVMYFLQHQKYLDIGVDFHGDPWAVAWHEKEPIYCALTFARLTEIEALGESDEAWRVRVHFLDKALQHLEHPSDEGPGVTVEFERFKTYVQDASGRYVGPQRAAFLAWVTGAIAKIESGRKDIADGAAGLSSAEQNKMLDDRIMFLRQLMKPGS